MSNGLTIMGAGGLVKGRAAIAGRKSTEWREFSMLIDVHCHISPTLFPDPPGPAASQWPCMRCIGCTSMLHMGERPFRELDRRSWDPSARIEDMDRDGIDVQVLSPMPELLSYWLDSHSAGILCDHVNAEIAQMIASASQRFRGLGAICLQSPETAHAQLLRLKREFGLSGVEIGSNINGQMLGDASLEPLFAAAEDLDMAVFVHALHPVVSKAASVTPLFTAFAGFPLDVAMAIASIVIAGIPDRYPSLRLGFSHGGGAIGAIAGRLDTGWLHSDGFGGVAASRPSEQLRRLFFDSNVYDQAYLRYLSAEMAPGQIFLGTDYPYPIMQRAPSEFIASAGLSALEEEEMRWGAASRFLNEPDWSARHATIDIPR